MKYGKKLEVIEKNSILKPHQNYLVNLDQSIAEILENKQLPPDVKVKLYSESIKKFINNYNLELERDNAVQKQLININNTLKDMPLLKQVKNEIDDIKESVKKEEKQDVDKISENIIENIKNHFKKENFSFYDTTANDLNFTYGPNESVNVKNVDETINQTFDEKILNETINTVKPNYNINKDDYKINFDTVFDGMKKTINSLTPKWSRQQDKTPISTKELKTNLFQETTTSKLNNNILQSFNKLMTDKNNLYNQANLTPKLINDLQNNARDIDSNKEISKIKKKDYKNKWNETLNRLETHNQFELKKFKTNNKDKLSINELKEHEKKFNKNLEEIEKFRNQITTFLNGDGFKWNIKKFY